MKKIFFVSIAIALTLINSSCVPNNPVLDNVCLNKSYYFTDYGSLKVVKKEDGNNFDEPYIINTGFRARWGVNCSGSVKTMEAPVKWFDTPYYESDRWPIPDKMAEMDFVGIGWQQNNDLATIINRINTQGITIFGNIAIIMEEDNTTQNTKNQVALIVNNALKIALDEVVGTGGVVNQQNINDRLTSLVGTLNLRARDIIQLAVGALIGSDDDIIGVDVNLNIDIPDYTLQLLNLTVNDFKVKVNVGAAANAAVSGFLDNQNGIVKLIGILVNNTGIITNSQGKIDISLSFGGVPPAIPTTAAWNRYNYEKTFTMKNQSDITQAIYTLYGQQGFYCYGTLNPAVPPYYGNQVVLGNNICQ
ncbi:MAG: hypothetical protein IPF58_09735 [Saprospirales bacterium]|nr:hypothetical protein [Saprospirales bacterium]